jgi:hypothetical protein
MDATTPAPHTVEGILAELTQQGRAPESLIQWLKDFRVERYALRSDGTRIPRVIVVMGYQDGEPILWNHHEGYLFLTRSDRGRAVLALRRSFRLGSEATILDLDRIVRIVPSVANRDWTPLWQHPGYQVPELVTRRVASTLPYKVYRGGLDGGVLEGQFRTGPAMHRFVRIYA